MYISACTMVHSGGTDLQLHLLLQVFSDGATDQSLVVEIMVC